MLKQKLYWSCMLLLLATVVGYTGMPNMFFILNIIIVTPNYFTKATSIEHVRLAELKSKYN